MRLYRTLHCGNSIDKKSLFDFTNLITNIALLTRQLGKKVDSCRHGDVFLNLVQIRIFRMTVAELSK